MPHGLDHIVHAVRDLDAAAEFYRRAASPSARANEVDDIAPAEALHRQNGVASQRHVGRLVIPPEVAHGATLIFETA